MTRIRLFGVAISVAIVFILHTPLHAQVGNQPPVRDTTAVRDTMPRDSAFVRDSIMRADSLRNAAARDSLPRQFPRMPVGMNGGFAAGEWSWDQEALLREGMISLGELLRRIPGVMALRAGGYVQPEAVTAFGLTGGRVQIEVDGYVRDPLTSSVEDIADIELINLAAVRVERRLDVMVIKLFTAEPRTGQPFTRIEAATGQPDANAFRGLFLVPYVFFGPLALALDRLDTDGIEGRETASAFTGWGKWTWTNGSRGAQIEFRRQTLEREPESPYARTRTRQDIILRARTGLFDGMTAELFGGNTSLSVPDTITADVPDSLKLGPLERSHWQMGARAGYERANAFASATARFRTSDALPKQELELSGGIRIASLLQLGADVRQQSWDSGGSAMTYNARAHVGPVAGLGAFVEIADGDRGAPFYADSMLVSTRESHFVNNRSAMRAGATFNRFGLDGGAAYVKIDATRTDPFWLPFDSGFSATRVTPAKGVEVWGRTELWRNRFALDASYTFWREAPGWTYVPTRSWRIAGEFHAVPLPSNNLELFARLESIRRGPMLAYGIPSDVEPEPGEDDLRYTPLEADHQLNAAIQIRIIDVRAFIQWEDILGKGRLDVPDRFISGPRMMYGVKWQLFN